MPPRQTPIRRRIGLPSARTPTPSSPRFPASPIFPPSSGRYSSAGGTTNIFERSLAQTAAGPWWTFYEGPPTTNGMPGVHHVEARVFKDLFLRFKTMQGYHVPRKAGWDCHGLPVEVAVEQELGLSGKKDIEAYGVAEFNARCRESVLRHVDAFEDLTERMGYWVDLSHAYRTMDPAYIESVWWSLKTIFDKGLLIRDYRISPYCPRCGTPLSDHELGQPGGYETVTDPSVTVRFPLLTLPEGAHPALDGRRSARVDHDALDARGQHGGRGPPGRDLRRRAAHGKRRLGRRGRALFAKVLGDGLAHRRQGQGRRSGGRHIRAAVRDHRHSRCPSRRHSRLRDHRGRHRPGPPGARVRRRRPGRQPPARAPRRQPGRARRPVQPGDPAGRRHVLQGRRRSARDRPDRPRPGVPCRAARAQLPALLAVPHPPALLRAAVLVHQDHRGQGPAAAAERADELVPAHDQARPVRRMAAEQRGLGAVPQQVLGHAAAAVGVP